MIPQNALDQRKYRQSSGAPDECGGKDPPGTRQAMLTTYKELRIRNGAGSIVFVKLFLYSPNPKRVSKAYHL